MKKRLSLKTLNIVVWVIYFASLIPLLYIGLYDYPSADDFGMGYPAYQALQEHGVFAAIGAAAYMAWYDYWNWMGYFTSTFFMSFPPSIFGETVYAVGIWIILALLTFSVCYFLHALLVKALKADRKSAGIASAVILFLMVQCMPQGMARVEAFYWYCSAANYLITFSQTLLFLGLLISTVWDEKRGKKRYDFIMACLLAFWIGGGNYLSALSCAILIVLYLLALLINDGKSRAALKRSSERNSSLAAADIPAGKKSLADESSSAGKRPLTGKCSSAGEIPHKGTEPGSLTASDQNIRPASDLARTGVMPDSDPSRRRWRHLLIIPSVLMLLGFAASCLAPGNNVRASGLDSTGPVKTIFICLHYTLEYCCSEWTNWVVVLIFAMMAPVLWHAVGVTDRRGEQRLSFRYPILAVLFGYGMVAANICPPMLAESNIGAGRLQALFWMQYVLVMVLLEWYLLGWLRRFMQTRFGTAIHKPAAGRFGSVTHRPAAGPERLSRTASRMIAFIAVFLLFGSAMSVWTNPDYYTFTSAIQDLANGNAQAYGQENAVRRALLKDPSQQEVRLESYAHEPDLLFFTDIEEIPEGWQNQALARYYHKKEVARTPNKRLENTD